MFTESATLYDHFYASKDYATEAAQIRTIVAERWPAATRLLDIACARLPALHFEQADMTDFSLGRRFDVVMCLFSSIGYTATKERLHAAVACMAEHLDDGGVLIFEPWVLPEAWRNPGSNTVEEVGLSTGRGLVVASAPSSRLP